MTSIDHGYSAEFDALISTFATTFGNDVADELESADELELATALRGALAGDSTAANFAVERAHGALKRLGAWPTPAWCECYVLAQLRRCAELLRSGDALEAQRALDMTLIFGAPSDALAPAVRAVESLYFSVVDARTSYVRSSRESGLLFPNEPPASKASDDIDRRLIERVEDAAAMSVNDFKRYYSIDAPVVLANLGKDWRALSTWDDLEWWRLFHGHRSVPLELGGYEDAHWREDVKTIARFVNEDLAPSLSDDPGTSHVAYLAQHQLVDQLASLREDFLIPTICLKSLERINVWMGTAGTVTPCHFDTYDNLLGQVGNFSLSARGVRFSATCSHSGIK